MSTEMDGQFVLIVQLAVRKAGMCLTTSEVHVN